MNRYWLNIKDKKLFLVKNEEEHWHYVFKNPEMFGLDKNDMVTGLMPHADFIDFIITSAMANGFVRISGNNVHAYSLKQARVAVAYLISRGYGEKIVVELENNKNGYSFAYLNSSEEIDRFVKYGTYDNNNVDRWLSENSIFLSEAERRDFIIKNYADRLDRKFWSENNPKDIFDIITGGNTEENSPVAEKIVDYISQYDPSPKKLYTLWLVQRYIKGELKLEDVPGSTHLLDFFDKNKRRFEKKDIGQYKNIAELSDAVSGFNEVSSVDLVNNQDMKIWYDSPNFMIAQPKSREGAIILGQETVWCTAWKNDNRWDHYSSKGSIFVFFDKVKKERYQFFFPDDALVNQSKRNSAEFMDRANKPIDLREFILAYPMVMKTLGEEIFYPYAPKIGIGLFSAEYTNKVGLVSIFSQVTNLDQLITLEDKLNEKMAMIVLRNFVFEHWIRDGIRNTQDKKDILKYLYDKGLVSIDSAVSLVEKDIAFINLFMDYPEFAKNERLVQTYAKYVDFQVFDEKIKKPWSEEVRKIYWSRFSTVVGIISEIPSNYKTSFETIKRCLKTKPYQDPTIDLTSEQLIDIFDELNDYQKNGFLKQLPEKYRLKEFAYYLVNHTKWNVFYSISDSIQSWSPSLWDTEFEKRAEQLIKKRVKWKELPKSFHTKELVQDYVSYHGLDSDIPVDLLDDTALSYAIRFPEYQNHEAIKTLSPERYIRIVDKIPSINGLFESIPEHLRKNKKVITHLIAIKGMPVKHMGSLATKDGIIDRVRVHQEEIKDVPSRFMESSLVASALTSPNLISFIDKKHMDVLDDKVLAVYIRVSAYKSENIEKFPESAWTSENIAEAMKRGIVPKDVSKVPEGKMNGKIVAVLAGKNPNILSNEEYLSMLSEEDCAYLVSTDESFFPQLRPEMITPRVIKSLLKYNSSLEEHVKKHIPFSKMDYECWLMSTGTVFRLKDVPKKFINNELILAAITRDASNIQYVDNPEKWLNENHNELFSVSNARKIEDGIRNAGLYKSGRHYVNVKDLDHTPLKNGYSYIVIQKATNFWAFIFDKKKNIIAQLYTNDRTLKTTDLNSIIDNAEIVRDFVFSEEDLLKRWHSAILNNIDLYESGTGFVRSKDQPVTAQRGEIDIQFMRHNDGMRYIISHKNKVVIDFITTALGGIIEDKIYAPLEKLWKISKDVYMFMDSAFISGFANKLRDAGIYVDGERVSLITNKLIEEHGDFSVWLGDGVGKRATTIYVMHKTYGYIASAIYRKTNGSLYDISYGWQYEKFGNEIDKLFDAMVSREVFKSL